MDNLLVNLEEGNDETIENNEIYQDNIDQNFLSLKDEMNNQNILDNDKSNINELANKFNKTDLEELNDCFSNVSNNFKSDNSKNIKNHDFEIKYDHHIDDKLLNSFNRSFDKENKILDNTKNKMSINPFEDENTNPFDDNNCSSNPFEENDLNYNEEFTPNEYKSNFKVNSSCSVKEPLCKTDLDKDETNHKLTTLDSNTVSSKEFLKNLNLQGPSTSSPSRPKDENKKLIEDTSSSIFVDDSFESSQTFYSSGEEQVFDVNEHVCEGSEINELLSNSVGYVKPYWVPDKEAPSCMYCNTKFNFIVRRHHCRACGKVLCSLCCHFFIKLPYLNFKEDRVCKTCVNLLDDIAGSDVSSRRSSKASSFFTNNSVSSDLSGIESMGAMLPSVSSSQIRPLESNNPNNPSCSNTGSVLVPVGVLKKPDRPKEQTNKQVMFSDGIRPGGDLTENQPTNKKQINSVSNFPSLSTFSTLLFPSNSNNNSLKTDSPPINTLSKKKDDKKVCKESILKDMNGVLPPLLNSTPLNLDSSFDDILNYLISDDNNYLDFYITKNLNVNVSIVNLDCCLNKYCWLFISKGLNAFGQDEILILLEKHEIELFFPRDVLRLYLHIYDNALIGKPLSDNNLILFEDGLFENKENSGFLFFRPTFQCLKKIKVPKTPYLFGILIQKWEVPWAKMIPLRLLLRLGSETNCYPCPILSQRFRKATFYEVGHTIMNILADFRNFKYTLPFIPGLYVELLITSEKKRKITVKIANNRHDLILKALNSSNDYVLAFGSTFVTSANYHLTCYHDQNEDQNHTQILGKDGSLNDFVFNKLEDDSKFLKQTIGASYIVFSGSLKTDTGVNAIFNNVEDGILIQLFPTTLDNLKQALKQKKPFKEQSKPDVPEGLDETVSIIWTEDDKHFNLGVKSLIDGRSLEGVQSIRIYKGSELSGPIYSIKWTEVFFVQHDQNKPLNSVEYTRTAGSVAQTLSVVLIPHLQKIAVEGIRKIALRISLNPDNADNYSISTNRGPIPAELNNVIDSALIPIIMAREPINDTDDTLVMELLFHILKK